MATIRMTTKLTALAAMFSIAVSGIAIAKTVNVKVRPGKATQIGGFVIFNANNCASGGYAEVDIKQPKNGVLTTKRYTTKFWKKKHHCYGKPLKGVSVYYRPKKGFRGKDQGTVYFRYYYGVNDTGGTRVQNYTYKITVK